MRQEKGNNLCGYYVCDFIHSLVGHNKQMTDAELEVRKNNLLPLFHVSLSHCICRKHSYLAYNIMFFLHLTGYGDARKPHAIGPSPSNSRTALWILLDEVINPKGEFYYGGVLYHPQVIPDQDDEE